MKIFSNFDTKLDVKAFLKKIKEYGDGNVLLVKRHPLFLYKAFFNALVALILFVSLTVIIYMQYQDNFFYFYVFLFLHLIGIGIWIGILFKKILSHLWNYKEFIECVKDLEKIDIGGFGSFLKYSVVLFFYQLLVSIFNIVVLYISRGNGVVDVSWGITIVVINILFLFLVLRVLKRFIDFEMDFIIVTKDEIESFNQHGIFRRKIVSIDLNKCRSITTEKKGFFRSVFNIGSLIILSEGDRDHHGEIRFNYIHRLGALKKAVLDLIYKNKKGGE